MKEKSTATTVRMPKSLVDRIDGAIEKYGYHTTRPDFIVSAMRNLFENILQARMEIEEKIREGEKDSELVGLLAFNTIKFIFDEWLDEYNSYEGEPVQIMVRIPSGLNRDIVEYKDTYKPYRNRLELIQASVILELETVGEIRELVNNPSSLLDDAVSKDELLRNVKELFKNGTFYKRILDMPEVKEVAFKVSDGESDPSRRITGRK